MTTPIIHRLGTTWLITPGTAAEKFDTMTRTGTDVALVDLEDSVPDHAKDIARTAALQFLSTSGASENNTPVLGLRLNGLSTLHGMKDVVAMAECAHTPPVVLVPKVESAREIELVAEVLNTDDRNANVWALIETPNAIQRLPDILRTRALAGVVFGAADYAAAAGCTRSRRALLYPRSALAASAAAANIPAIDSPFFDLHDLDGLRREAQDAKELGFVGKGAVHPTQLPIIKDTFTPSARELAAASAVVAAADTARGGITTVHGQMVGPPLVAAARLLTTRAGNTTNSQEGPS